MRTDIHRKGAIIPADYQYVMSYSLPTTQEGWPVPSYNVNCIIDTNHAVTSHTGNCCVVGMHEDATKKFAKYGCTGKCTICGASYIYGDIWQHMPTGEYIHVGHMCVDKMASQDRRAFEHGRVKFINRQIELVRLKEFCDANEGMKQVFEFADQNSVIQDMKTKVLLWGNLSEKQIAYAKSLAEKILNPVPKPDAPEPLVLNDGRGTYTGSFVSIKTDEGPFGYVTKGLFIVVKDGKQAKIWMTVPSDVEKNVEATIAVTLKKGNEIGFYFGSRPTLKKVLDLV